MRTWCLIALFMLGSTSGWAMAEDEAGDRGKALFTSATLGTNGKSCATCHPGGRKLEWAATYPDNKLAHAINACISQALKGKPFAEDAAELQALIRYIKTFAGP
jgi:cytochrome c